VLLLLLMMMMICTGSIDDGCIHYAVKVR